MVTALVTYARAAVRLSLWAIARDPFDWRGGSCPVAGAMVPAVLSLSCCVTGRRFGAFGHTKSNAWTVPGSGGGFREGLRSIASFGRE